MTNTVSLLLDRWTWDTQMSHSHSVRSGIPETGNPPSLTPNRLHSDGFPAETPRSPLSLRPAGTRVLRVHRTRGQTGQVSAAGESPCCTRGFSVSGAQRACVCRLCPSQRWKPQPPGGACPRPRVSGPALTCADAALEGAGLGRHAALTSPRARPSRDTCTCVRAGL